VIEHVPDPLVSVVIPVRDMEATIGSQLAALARQDFTGSWEIVIADNGSRDGTPAVVEQWLNRLPIRIVDATGPAYAGYARNVGVCVATGELLVFCDADDEVRPDWLRTMVAAVRRRPLVAGGLDHARLNPPQLVAAYAPSEQGAPNWGFLPVGRSANLGMRRSVFDQLGGFRHYRRGGCTDFCWRAQLAGYELTSEPAAVVDRRLMAASRWQLFLIHVRRGREVVRLYESFRDHGMTRSPLPNLIYDYARIPIWLVTGRSYGAARIAGWRIGRLVGSIRSAVLYP
jgi:glycosyltransferase involved in cell wall biosynthesis